MPKDLPQNDSLMEAAALMQADYPACLALGVSANGTLQVIFKKPESRDHKKRVRKALQLLLDNIAA